MVTGSKPIAAGTRASRNTLSLWGKGKGRTVRSRRSRLDQSGDDDVTSCIGGLPRH